VNLLDGAFFGFALGIASFTTIIPLFVSTMTDSATLIGLIPAIHTMGWQLPQLFTAKKVSRLIRFRPFVILQTINERVPFIGLGIIALLIPFFKDKTPLLIMTFVMLIWQGIGGGFTANGWQNLIGKIIPSDYLTTFFGIQSSAANLLSSAGAVIAGLILERLSPDKGFAICFFSAAFFMVISWISLALTKENDRIVDITDRQEIPIFTQVKKIFKTNPGFIWFLVCRNLIQFGLMASSFYTIYCVRILGMDTLTIGWMTSILFITSVITNPIMGYLADHWKRRPILIIGALTAALAAFLASVITNQYWFSIVFLLNGVAGATIWNTSMTFAMEFGAEEDRPTFIGMSNTLIAPSAIFAPIIGGWLADNFNFGSTFIVSTVLCLLTAGILRFVVSDPSKPVHQNG
jgi:MFS family permease